MKEQISVHKMKSILKHYVKNLKRQLMTKDFLGRLEIHIKIKNPPADYCYCYELWTTKREMADGYWKIV